MATLAINSDDWDALAPEQQVGLVMAAELPQLGEPAMFTDESDVLWRIHDDHRITEDQVAIVAALMENPEAIPLPPVEETEDV